MLDYSVIHYVCKSESLTGQDPAQSDDLPVRQQNKTKEETVSTLQVLGDDPQAAQHFTKNKGGTVPCLHSSI
jgi:hypothetical protein